jgi:ABC-2 type transport system ATP-binding protein
MQEVEAVCNRVLIINKGRIVADGGISEIKSGKLQNSQQVIAGFAEPVASEQLLAVKEIKSAIQDGKTWLIESDGTTDIRPLIFRFAVDNNLTLLTLQEKQQNLESIFHQLTRENVS